MEHPSLLIQIAVFLAAAAIAAPVAKRLKIGAVLGYLAAGVLIGPNGIGASYSIEVENILHFAEFGVVLLLFVIGLELRPQRLWTMRSAIFGLGSAQVLITGSVFSAIAFYAGFDLIPATLVGFALSLSATAFVLQVLDEKKELSARHGRYGFSVLLFQDLFAIPLIAITAFLGAASATQDKGFDPLDIGKGILTIILVVLVGKFVLDRMYRLIAATGVIEAMTASALLTVVSVALLMEWAGLSQALGAFIAGALLADSPYRHQIQADIKPFEGLLLGLFFTAIGMSLNIALFLASPWVILAIVATMIVIKAVILYALALLWGIENASSRRFAIYLSQGGEFAFVIFAAAAKGNVIANDAAQLLTLAVTLSMIATPFLLLIDDYVFRLRAKASDEFEVMPEEKGHVIIAGFGRFGQIVARVLQAKHIPFTALDKSSEQIDFVRRFGNKIYYGDATRLAVLRAAKASEASLLVIAIDDVEGSLKLVELVKQNFPDLPIYARARNRQHVYRLLDRGVTHTNRETFLSALDMTKDVLIELGESHSSATRAITTFRDLDRKRLYEDYSHASDIEKLQARAKTAAKELEEMFERDAKEQDDLEKGMQDKGKEQKGNKKPKNTDKLTEAKKSAKPSEVGKDTIASVS